MNYIDLFAGCGGLSLGLHNAGLKGIFAVEKNQDAFETLEYNLIKKRDHFEWPNWLEKSNWDINELLTMHKTNLTKLRGKVDLVVGGPPCQGFSLAGLRRNDDVRNLLSESYLKFVNIVKPKMLFFENVSGFTVGFKNNKDEKEVPYSLKLKQSLEKMGYTVSSKMIDTSEYGVPQKRKRFILFACRESDPNDFFDYLETNKSSFLILKGIKIPVTMKQAIGDLERKSGETNCPDNKNFQSGIYASSESNYQKLMRRGKRKGMIPDSHRFAKHREDSVKLFKELMSVSEVSLRITPSMGMVKDLKKRGVTPLKESAICPTITSIPDDFIHYSEPRIMTVREHARIQSFPDNFYFKGKYTTGGDRRKVDVPRYTQVANAVPPLFAEQVGNAIMSISK